VDVETCSGEGSNILITGGTLIVCCLGAKSHWRLLHVLHSFSQTLAVGPESVYYKGRPW